MMSMNCVAHSRIRAIQRRGSATCDTRSPRELWPAVMPHTVTAWRARNADSIAAMDALVPQIDVDEAEDAARQARFPIGAAIEFADLELDSRVGALDRLRDVEPISWVPALGGWLVTSHALARELLSRRDDFTVWAEPNLVRASLGVMMLTSDGDEHARQRRPFDEPFGVRRCASASPSRCSAHIDALLARARPARSVRAGRGVRRAVRDRPRGRRARPLARRRGARAGVLRGVRGRHGLRRRPRAAAARRRRARRAERDPAGGGASARARGRTSRSRAPSRTTRRAGSPTTRSSRSCA